MSVEVSNYFQKFNFKITPEELSGRLEEIKPGHRDRVSEIIKNFSNDPYYVDLVLLNQYMDLGEGFLIDMISKSTPLSKEEEWEVRRHPIFSGYVISNLVQDGILDREIFSAVLYHHERWDGKGIFQIKKKDIPLIVRIISPIDFYVDLTSDNPSRKALSHQEALGRLILRAGKIFDPDIIQDIIWAINTPPPICPRSRNL